MRPGNKFIIAVATMVIVLTFAWLARAQTPPVSTVTGTEIVMGPDLQPTGQVAIFYEVESYLPWTWAGIYYRIEGTTGGWLYAGAASGGGPVLFTPPVWDVVYQFASQVDDNNGNAETYPGQRPEPQHEYECTLTLAPGDGDCPPVSDLEALQILAASGYSMEADTPMLEYWWTHPTTGTQVDYYDLEWEVDGVVSTPPIVPYGDPDHGTAVLPVTIGQSQRLRVRGWDANEPPRSGPWSEWSEMWTDDGPPGQPGDVQRTLIMVD